MKLESTQKLQRARLPLLDYLMGAVMYYGKMRRPRGKHAGSSSPMNRDIRTSQRKRQRLNKQKGRA
jgi:hypothetical protein